MERLKHSLLIGVLTLQKVTGTDHRIHCPNPRSIPSSEQSYRPGGTFPFTDIGFQEWLVHIEIKKLHFEAVAQYRKASDDNAAREFGDQIARLTIAKACAQQGLELYRRNKNVSKLLQANTADLLTALEPELAGLTRDNDLIYHQDVTPASRLTAIKEADVVKAVVVPELSDPNDTLRRNGELPIFGELVAHGVRMAVGTRRSPAEPGL